MDDDDRPRGDGVKPQGRRPICMDCRGTGTVGTAKAFINGSGEPGTLVVPGRCPNCRGSGKAGAP